MEILVGESPRDKCDSCNTDLTNRQIKNNNRFCSLDCAYGNRSHNFKETVLFTCDYCGSINERVASEQDNEKSFCDNECLADWRSENVSGKQSWNYRNAINSYNCKQCSEYFESYEKNRKFCSKDCKGDWHSENLIGEDNPAFESLKLNCEQCATIIYRQPHKVENSSTDRYYCSDKCHNIWRRENLVGKDSHAWKGGHEDYYGENCHSKRREVLERDNNECVVCGKGEKDLKRSPDVHHIIPVRKFNQVNNANKLDNLITLCREHHGMAEKWGILPFNCKGVFDE